MYIMDLSMSKNWIDTHFHVFNAGVAVEGARYVPQYSAQLSDWIRHARNVGVTRGVWVQPSFLGTDNSLMIDALESHPDKLRGIAVVSPDACIEHLESLHQSGVCGIRLNLSGISHDIPEWTRSDNIWAAIHRLNWHLEVHTDEGQLPHVLHQIPSDLTLVVDHMAKPLEASASDPTLLALKKRARVAQVYVKLSGAYRLGDVNPGRLASLFIREMGPSALLWGSDWPCTNHEQFAHFETLIAQAHEWIDAQAFEQVMVRNPSQLYGFDGLISRDLRDT
jgi:predicted TIM-barrel fold metal-dependent hydrolase